MRDRTDADRWPVFVCLLAGVDPLFTEDVLGLDLAGSSVSLHRTCFRITQQQRSVAGPVLLPSSSIRTAVGKAGLVVGHWSGPVDQLERSVGRERVEPGSSVSVISG